jgi:hypothetical protein
LFVNVQVRAATGLLQLPQGFIYTSSRFVSLCKTYSDSLVHWGKVSNLLQGPNVKFIVTLLLGHPYQ